MMAAVGTVGVTGNLYINGVLQGTKWGVNALTFSFPTNAAYYGTPYGSGESANGFEAFNVAQQSAVRSILKQYSAVANFTFTEIAETSTQHGEIRYAESDLPATAWSYYPSTSALGGDAWFNNSKNLYDAPVLGNYAWLILMHETGHAMGLKHPHAASGSFGVMPVDRDSLEYTVMSYRSYIGASPTGLTSEAYGYPQSLMMYDIAGLQTMYGANYATNSGNTVYSWNPLTGQQSINGVAQTAPGGNRIFLTVWDGGGQQDTYDFSNYTTNLKVDLNPGAWTTVSSGQLANLGGGKLAAGNIANALLYNGNVASLIENAIGGIGNDTLIGNVADNKLTGGRGNDILNGGAGTDTAVYSGLSTNYQVIKNANGSWTVTDLRAGSPDGTDTLTNIEKIQYSNTLTLIGATGSVNQPPVVTAPDITVTAKQTIAASTMFTVKDAENNAITKYQFWDDSPEATSGYWVVGGVAKPADVMVEITAAQLAQTYFVAGSTSDILSIRAFDGTSWGVWDNLVVTPTAVVTPPPSKPVTNTAPVVTAPDITVTAKQTIAASTMFTVKDAENNAITKYQFWDDSPEATSGYWVVGGVAKPADVMVEITAAQLAQTYFVAGSTSDILSIRAFDGTSWGVWDNLIVTPKAVVTPPPSKPVTNTAPVVTAPDITVTAKQTIAASTMFTVKDAENNAITKYQFWDDSPEATSGYWVVGGVAKPADVMVEITAAQLAQTYFVAGSTSDILSIRAFDGTSWGAWDNLIATPKVVVTPTTPTDNIAPVVTTKNMVATAKQTIAASSMFTVKDAENNTITKYQFWDDSVEATSGHFVVGGVVKAADTMIEISAAQLSQTAFVAGSTADVISVRAFDGKSWGEWDNFLVKPPTSLTPVVTSDNIVAHPQQTIAASSMFAIGKTAGAITKYQFWDDSPETTSGHFVVGGVVKAADTMIEVTASQLSQTYFVAGSTADILSVRAFDGKSWGAWDNLLVKPYAADIVAAATTQNIVANPHQTMSASSLIAGTKAAGSFARYQFWDDSPEATSGHFVVGGVARAADTMIEVTAAQLAQTYFVTGSTADILSVRVFDGTSWGEWDNFLVKPPTNLSPLVTTENILATSQQVIAASSMFEVTKTANAITKYQFWDDSVEATSGHFTVGGVAKAADTMIEVTAAQLSQTHFVAGSTADVLSVRAFDGTSWGAWDNFLVKPAANAAAATANAAPVVATEDIAAPTKAVIAASSMFTAKDTDGVVTKYQLWDDTADASSGHFTLDGRNVADTTFEVTAAKLSQVSFVVGSTSDDVKVRAFDGQAWSEWKPISVTPTPPAAESNHVAGTNYNDILVSTSANDVMRGGSGVDTFVFGPNLGKDVIADIQLGGVGHDYVEFVHAGLANFADLMAHAEQVGNNVTIAIDGANTLTLQNTTVSSIAQHHDHFLFVA